MAGRKWGELESSGSPSPVSESNTRRSMLLKKTRFGDLRRSTFEADVEEQEFRLATQPATGTVRSRRTRSTCQYRLSEGRINRFAVAGQPSRVCGRDRGSGTRHHTVALPIIAGFFAGLGRYRSARSQSPVRSLHRPSPTHNAAISRVRNITSLQDKP